MLSIAKEEELSSFISGFYLDPYGFVMSVYPWGDPTLPDGSPNPLKEEIGPEDWQKEELLALGEHIRENALRMSIGLDPLVWRSAYATGHGVGKTAFVAWIIHFFMATRRDTRGAVTATTQFQLEDKTWPELAKWHNMLMCKHWFKWSATGYTFAAYPEERQKNYKISAATVSEHNTEAFAGLHNMNNTVLIVFDEASGVKGKVWEVSEGAMTDGECYFMALGNPTIPDGEFADCFDKYGHIYRHRHIDSRDVRHTNKTALADMIRKYGIEHDVVKVRVLGQFPSQSYAGFISHTAIDEAMKRTEVKQDFGAALIMAVDVAHYGNNETVIGFRQGWDARSIPILGFRNLSVPEIVDRVAKIADAKRPDAIVIESVGGGIGVCDLLLDRKYKVHRAYPGARSKQELHYENQRAQWWADLRDWIYEHGALPEDRELYRQLAQIQYLLSKKTGKILIESKEGMSKRGLQSPDRADMLALTFAVRIARRDRTQEYHASRNRRLAQMDYDPLSL